MKFILVIITSLALAKVYAQENTKQFEFGAALFSISTEHYPYASDYSSKMPPKLEFVNGLFFRYTPSQFAWRGSIAYYRGYFDYKEQMTFQNFNSYNQIFTVGLGTQYSLIPKQEWLYCFLNLNYKNIQTKVNVNRFWYEGWVKTNGIATDFGLGVKLKIVRDFYLSTEFYYDILFAKSKGYSYPSIHLNEFNRYSNVGARFLLTLKF